MLVSTNRLNESKNTLVCDTYIASLTAGARLNILEHPSDRSLLRDSMRVLLHLGRVTNTAGVPNARDKVCVQLSCSSPDVPSFRCEMGL